MGTLNGYMNSQHEMNAIIENIFHMINSSQRLHFDQGGMGRHCWEGSGKGLGISFGDIILRGNTETEH